MKGLSAIRKQALVWGRHVLGIFLISWTALILQPCAIAGGLEHDCPHCPPEVTHEAHQSEGATGADCTIGGQLGFEARGGQLKSDDPSSNLPVFVGPAFDEISLTPASFPLSSVPASHLYPSGPPLNVLNCVYLK